MLTPENGHLWRQWSEGELVSNGSVSLMCWLKNRSKGISGNCIGQGGLPQVISATGLDSPLLC